mgnify:CR=1 FL=1
MLLSLYYDYDKDFRKNEPTRAIFAFDFQPFSISTALPPMLTTIVQHIMLLKSSFGVCPFFSVVAMLLLNPFVDKWLNDRQLIMTGLILLSSAGIFPFFVQWYPLVLLSRLVLEWVSVSSMPRLFLSLVSVTRAKRGFRCLELEVPWN